MDKLFWRVSLPALGITAYLEQPEVRVEVARHLPGHAETETTFLYGRRAETISLDEIERIGIWRQGRNLGR